MDWESIRGDLAVVLIMGWLVFMLTRWLGRRPRPAEQDRLDIPLRGPETWWEPGEGLGFDPGSLVRIGPLAVSLDARLQELARRAAVAKLSVRWREVEIVVAQGVPEEARQSAAEEATRIARALDRAPRAQGDVVALALEHLDARSNGGAFRAAVLTAIVQGRRQQRRVAEAVERARADEDPLVALAAARALGDGALERSLAERLRAREGTLALADDGQAGGLALAGDGPEQGVPDAERAPAEAEADRATTR